VLNHFLNTTVLNRFLIAIVGSVGACARAGGSSVAGACGTKPRGVRVGHALVGWVQVMDLWSINIYIYIYMHLFIT
jgi:hypothetical protein